MLFSSPLAITILSLSVALFQLIVYFDVLGGNGNFKTLPPTMGKVVMYVLLLSLNGAHCSCVYLTVVKSTRVLSIFVLASGPFVSAKVLLAA